MSPVFLKTLDQKVAPDKAALVVIDGIMYYAVCLLERRFAPARNS